MLIERRQLVLGLAQCDAIAHSLKLLCTEFWIMNILAIRCIYYSHHPRWAIYLGLLTNPKVDIGPLITFSFFHRILRSELCHSVVNVFHFPNKVGVSFYDCDSHNRSSDYYYMAKKSLESLVVWGLALGSRWRHWVFAAWLTVIRVNKSVYGSAVECPGDSDCA